MGIHRFLHWLRQEENVNKFSEVVTWAPAEPSPLEKRSIGKGGEGEEEEEDRYETVVVDGYGLWIKLAELCARPTMLPEASPLGPAATFKDADVLGGDYWQLAAAVASLVRTLYTRYHVRLVFAIDGKQYSHLEEEGVAAAAGDARDTTTSPSQEGQVQQRALDVKREEVRDGRARKRLETRMYLYDYCFGKTSRKTRHSGDQLPLPPLAFHQIRCVLQRLHAETSGRTAEVVYVGGEVDAEIGALVRRYHADVVLTNDSDFCVVEGVRVTLLSDLPLPLLLRADGEAVPAAAAAPLSLRYFSAARLCQGLHVSQAQLELAASLAGNDVTGDGEEHDGERRNPFPEAIALLQQAAAAETDTEMEREKLEARRADPHIVASVFQYRQSATGPCSLDRDPVVRRCQVLPSSVHTLYRYGISHKERKPFCHQKFAYLRDLPTFRELFYTTAALVGRETVRLYDDQQPDAAPTVVSVRDHLPSRVQPFFPPCAPSEPRALPTVADPQLLLCALFCQPPSPRPPATDLFFLSCVLWTTRPGLLGPPELRQLAYTVALTRALSVGTPAERKGLARVLQKLHADRGASTRAQSRAMEMAELAGHSFHSTHDVFALALGPAAGASGRATIPACVPEPSRFMSGTVLHLVVTWDLTSEQRIWEAARGVTPQEKLTLTAAAATAEALLAPLLTSAAASESVFLDVEQFPFQPSPLVELYSWEGLMLRDTAEGIAADGDGGDTTLHLAAGQRGVQKQLLVQTDGFSAAAAAAEDATHRLPVEAHREAILAHVAAHRVVCIQGDTGCGKSSMVPLFLLQEARAQGRDAYIVVTQPRRLAATSLATRVASLLGEEVGVSVGYRLGGGDHKNPSRGRSCILFVTTGYLLELLAHSSRESMLPRLTHMLLDEVHERSVEADMLGLVLKLLLTPQAVSETAAAAAAAGREEETKEAAAARRLAWWAAQDASFRDGCPRLLVMSATMAAEQILDFYSPVGWTPMAPVLHVGAKRFEVEELYLDQVLKEWAEKKGTAALPAVLHTSLKDIVARFCKVEEKMAPSWSDAVAFDLANIICMTVRASICVLVFLPGLREIEAVSDKLREAAAHLRCKLRLHILHSAVAGEEQSAVMELAGPDECKIVLATNIAETSITIPDVKMVIDLGLSRHVVYDKKRNMRVLQLQRCSQAAARQRMGRAGRVSRGTILRLYTEAQYNKLLPFAESELFPLEYSVLLVRDCLAAFGHVRDVMQMLIEPPEAEDVDVAIGRLIEWEALGPEPTLDLLRLGRVAVRLPIDVTLSRAILEAAAYGCATEMTIIVAGMSLSRPLIRHQMRNFYDSQFEFEEGCAGALRAIHLLDEGRRNDLFLFLKVYELCQLHAPGHTGQYGSKAYYTQRDRNDRYYLSPPQLRSLASTTRDVARRLWRLVQPSDLTERDRANLRILAGEGRAEGKEKKEGNRREKGGLATTAAAAEDTFELTALKDPSAGYFLQLVCAHAAEGVVRVSTTPNDAAVQAEGMEGSPADRVLLKGVPEAVLPPRAEDHHHQRDGKEEAAAQRGIISLRNNANSTDLTRALQTCGPLAYLQCDRRSVNLPATGGARKDCREMERLLRQLGAGGGDGTCTVRVQYEATTAATLAMPDKFPEVQLLNPLRHPSAVSPSVFALLRLAEITQRKGVFLFSGTKDDADPPTYRVPQSLSSQKLSVISVSDGADREESSPSFSFDRWSAMGRESAFPSAAAAAASHCTTTLAFAFQIMAYGNEHRPVLAASLGMLAYLPSSTNAHCVEPSFHLVAALAARPPVHAVDTLVAEFHVHPTAAVTLEHCFYPFYTEGLHGLYPGCGLARLCGVLLEVNVVTAMTLVEGPRARGQLRALLRDLRKGAEGAETQFRAALLRETTTAPSAPAAEHNHDKATIDMELEAVLEALMGTEKKQRSGAETAVVMATCAPHRWVRQSGELSSKYLFPLPALAEVRVDSNDGETTASDEEGLGKNKKKNKKKNKNKKKQQQELLLFHEGTTKGAETERTRRLQVLLRQTALQTFEKELHRILRECDYVPEEECRRDEAILLAHPRAAHADHEKKAEHHQHNPSDRKKKKPEPRGKKSQPPSHTTATAVAGVVAPPPTAANEEEKKEHQQTARKSQKQLNREKYERCAAMQKAKQKQKNADKADRNEAAKMAEAKHE